jgi:hypothetical protein
VSILRSQEGERLIEHHLSDPTPRLWPDARIGPTALLTVTVTDTLRLRLDRSVRKLFQGTLPARTCWSGVPPFQERGEDVCAQCKLKTRSKNIELVTSNGRVTDTTSAETNLAGHLTSCAWRLEQVSKLLSAPPRARVEPQIR